MKEIILASSSPRRRNILKKHNVRFKVVPSPFAEKHTSSEFDLDLIEGLAFCKADALALTLTCPAYILSADTMVVFRNKIYGKPKDKFEAIKMLRELSDHTHQVVTSVCLLDFPSMNRKIVSTTSKVTFFKLSTKQITDYVEKYKPFDKAGAYGIQELPSGFVKTTEGSLENIIGIDGEITRLLIEEFRLLFP